MANRVIVNSEDLKDRLVAINRTTKVTKGGRTFTFAAIVVVGDGKGVIGHGLVKLEKSLQPLQKALRLQKEPRKGSCIERNCPSWNECSFWRC